MGKVKATRSSRVQKAGTKFASTFEAQIADYLSAIGAEWEYEPIRLPWIPKLRHYVPDFHVKLPSGESFYLEAKGYFDAQARMKMQQIKEQYPNLDIRMFFMNEDVKIPPAKVSTYGDWARKVGYTYYTFDKNLQEGTGNGNDKGRRRKGNSKARANDGKSADPAPGKAPKPGTQLGSANGRSKGARTRGVQKKKEQTCSA